MRGLNRSEFALLAEIIDGVNSRDGDEQDIEVFRKLARRGLVVISEDVLRGDGSFTLSGKVTPMGCMIYRVHRTVL